MVNGNGTFVYNGYDADGSWYAPEEPVIPRVYHEKAKEFNIKDLLYPQENTNDDEEEPTVEPDEPQPQDEPQPESQTEP